MNKHGMSVASLRVGTPLGFDQRSRAWVDASGVGGDGAVGVVVWGAGSVGARLARGRGGGARTRVRGKSACEFSFILCLSNASDNLQVPRY